MEEVGILGQVCTKKRPDPTGRALPLYSDSHTRGRFAGELLLRARGDLRRAYLLRPLDADTLQCRARGDRAEIAARYDKGFEGSAFSPASLASR